MSLITTLSTICITLFGLYGSFLLLTNHGNKFANKFLGIFFLLWALDFVDGILHLNGFYLKNPNFSMWNEPFVFLFGPLLYFFTLASVNTKLMFKRQYILHLLPFVVVFLILLFSFHFLSNTEKQEILKNVILLKQPSELYVFVGLLYLHFFVYIFLSKKIIRQTIKLHNQFYSHHDFKWLNKLLNSFIVILLISICTMILQYKESSSYLEIGLPLIAFIMAVFIGKIIWNALHRPLIEHSQNISRKHPKVRLTIEENKIILNKINKALKVDKLYLNPELNLNDFSSSINCNSRKVSQAINDSLGKNFFDLINSYRIDEAKEKFKKNADAKLTVLEVMYAVGFNSKSSFNTQFKNKVGLTPSEYLKSNS